MTEQEARTEAERRMPIFPGGVTDTREVPRIEKERARFVEGAEWERARLSSRVVEAAPSDTDRMLRARLTIAEAIIAEATHCVREEFPHEQILAVLRNPLPPLRVSEPVKALSDTDRPPATPIERPGVTVDKTLGELLNVTGDSEANAVWQARMQNISEAEGRAFRAWANRDLKKLGQMQGFIAGQRASQPVQVEVTADMVERAGRVLYSTWDEWAGDDQGHRELVQEALEAALGGEDRAE